MKIKTNRGFSLVEVIIAAAVFVVVAMPVYQGFATITNLVSASRDKVAMVDLINSEFELVRNLPYASVGLEAGIPVGVLASTATVVKDGRTFQITRTIRNIDDPFDGTIGGDPNDPSPADYKMVQISILCQSCKSPLEMSATSNVSPKNLETASTNGALFIRVFDANGNPLPLASVHVTNPNFGIDIIDTTNNDGLLALVDVPPDNSAYRIVVTKAGYTTDRTYPITVGNPNPVKPDATVILQQVTQVSFIIDKVSTINVRSKNLQCGAVANIPFTISGQKLIGLPSLLKFSGNYSTDGSGIKTLNNIEWDMYNMVVDAGFNLAGVNPQSPFLVIPDSTQNVDIIISNGVPNNLLVSVKDSATGLPLSGVTLTLDQGTANVVVRTTGSGYLEQSNWSGGSGQANFVDVTKYWASDGNIDIDSPAGEVKLRKELGSYVESGVLTSSIFDTGAPSNFSNIVWLPTDQPPHAGVDSVKFQFASSTDNTEDTEWKYLGPDGTSNTYYTLANNNIDPASNGNRYFRYKIFLHTNASNKTPNLASVAITYTSECIPPGQAIFDTLSSGNHDLKLEKAGYQTKVYVGNILTNFDWQSVEAEMSPL